MDLKPTQKVETSFSLASMTDIVFQLLIFFMLTSSFVTPAALPVNLPSSSEAPAITPDVQVTITGDYQYFVNNEPVTDAQLDAKMQEALAISKEAMVVINMDKEEAVKYLVRVASLANKLGAKVSVATKVETE